MGELEDAAVPIIHQTLYFLPQAAPKLPFLSCLCWLLGSGSIGQLTDLSTGLNIFHASPPLPMVGELAIQ